MYSETLNHVWSLRSVMKLKMISFCFQSLEKVDIDHKMSIRFLR